MHYEAYKESLKRALGLGLNYRPEVDCPGQLFLDAKYGSRRNKGLEVQFHRLKTIMNALGHGNIDILKMDIEGATYELVDDLLASQIRIDQILVEFHHNRFQKIGVSDTKKAIRNLQAKGVKLISISEKQVEFSFIRIEP